MYETNRTAFDCVPVSFANYFGIPYETVLEKLKEIATYQINELNKEYPLRNGICRGVDQFCNVNTFGINNDIVIEAFKFFNNGKINISNPRRGVNKLTGVARLYKANKRKGHCVCLIDGYVFNTDGNVQAIDYWRLNGWHVNQVFS
jgi:hypothetical protein